MVRKTVDRQQHLGSINEIESALDKWNIRNFEIVEEMPYGSPRRSIERYLIIAGDKFLLEKVAWRKMVRKKKEAQLMEHFRENGLPILSYLKNSEGSYFSEINNHLWMLREYTDGLPLPRPEFIHHGWRGKVLGDFLIEMRSLSSVIEGEVFSLKRFIEGQRRLIKRRNSEIDIQLHPVYSYLEDFMENYDDLPLAFNHGDFHPMNVIWSEKGIKAIIDWEFMGIKPELYDAANMVGCAGIENPNALYGEFVMEFLNNLKKSEIFSDTSWRYFPQFVVALRFAWLNEWIKSKDEEMIEMEIFYMNLLSESDKELRDAWSLYGERKAHP